MNTKSKVTNPVQQDKSSGFFESVLGGCIYLAAIAIVVIVEKNKGATTFK